jgi:hypothetical protein
MQDLRPPQKFELRHFRIIQAIILKITYGMNFLLNFMIILQLVQRLLGDTDKTDGQTGNTICLSNILQTKVG